jgi:N-acyl homoserine lactone hydrolase
LTHVIIRPIALCAGTRDQSQWTYRWNVGCKGLSAYYIWYLEGADPITIVDAGMQAEQFTNPEFPASPLTSLEEGLRRYGLTPGDVKQVIVTHLHIDHIALSRKYINATFLVQQKEMHFAQHPHVFLAADYLPDSFSDLNCRFLDGDQEVMPGVRVLLTPGHSPGGQSVAVSTEQGLAIITGFCSQMSTFIQTPAMKARGLEVAAAGLHIDCREVYESALRVKRAADIIVPVHDPMFMEMDRIG